MVDKRRHTLLLAGPLLCLIVLHAVLLMERDRLLIFADEAGYLGNARYLAGGLPIKLLNSGAYYPGYSLLLVPIFWLGLTPTATYQVTLLFNGLLLSTVYISLVYWLRAIVREDSYLVYGAAFTAALYPAFFTQAGFAMSESAVIAFHALLPLVLYWLVRSRTLVAGLSFGLLAAFLYTIHPRLLGTIVSASIALILVAMVRLIPIKVAGAAAAALVAGTVGARALTAHVAKVNEGSQISGEATINRVSSLSGLWSIIVESVGQLWYLHVASYGVVFLGIFVLVRTLFAAREAGASPRLRDPGWHAALLLLLSAGSAIAVACIFLARGQRVDHMIYGRYNEAVIAPLLALGVWGLTRQSTWRIWLYSVLAVTALALGGAAFLMLVRGESLSGRPNLANVVALLPHIRLLKGVFPLTIALVSISVFVCVSALSRWRRAPAVGLLGATFLVVGWMGSQFFVRMQGDRVRRTALVSKLADVPDLRSISYDASSFDPVLLFSAQYWYPDVPFDFFASKDGERPSSSVVISGESWRAQKPLSGTLMGKDRAHALWTVGVCCESTDASFVKYGARAVEGAPERGFYRNESWDGLEVRWTDGDAQLGLPLTSASLEDMFLVVDLARVGRRDGTVSILANGKPLFQGGVAEGRLRLYLPLKSVPVSDVLDVRLKSDTFVPAEHGRTNDTRSLGVAVAGIRVVSECCIPDQ